MALISSTATGPLGLDSNSNAVPGLGIAVAAPLFQNTRIPDDGKTYIIPIEHQYTLFRALTLDGILTMDGEVVVFE